MRKSLILIAMIIGNLLTAVGEILWQGNHEIIGWENSTNLIFDNKEHNTEAFGQFCKNITSASPNIYIKIENRTNDSDLRISGQWGDWGATAFPEDGYNHLQNIDENNIVAVNLTSEFIDKAFNEQKGGIAFFGKGGFRITAIATTKDELMDIKLPDPDREGINWNVADCMVERIIKAFAQDGNVNEVQNPPEGGHDHDNATYLGVSRDVAAGNNNQPFYVVAELKKAITVSDVELVWGNGYPLNYEVYALTTDPGEAVADALVEGKLLYSVTGNPVVSYEPYFNTMSELQGKGNQNGDTQYVVIKMWEPMGSTFGFKLDEIHVGAYDDEYNVVDHISVGNLTFNTEKSNARQLAPSARNSRNAILTGHTVTSVKYEVSSDQYVNIENTGGQNKVWASFPGEYNLTVTGTVDKKETVSNGICYLTVNRDWRSETTNTKSIIQDLPKDNFEATQTQDEGSTEYYVEKLQDGNEGTRWSSGASEASATSQYITIKLSDTNEYKVRALEFLWERAYPLTYAVYGFSEKPNVTGGSSYDDYKTSNENRLIYEATLPSGTEAKEVFPFHDFHQQGETGFNSELNDTKYLVVAFKEPITQLNGDKYGVSIWELYAQVTDMTALNSTNQLEADNMVLYLKETNVDDFTVRATDGGNESVVVTGVEFGGAAYKEEGKALATEVTLNTEVNRYEVKNNDGVLVAEIWDAGNNTYKIKAGSDKSIAGKRYNITAKYVKGRSGDGNNDELTTTFTLDIIKKPMDLVSQDPRHLVFDDGYYVESRLEKYASPEVLTVDLTNVDFESDYKDESLTATKIPAPRFLNKEQKNGKYAMKEAKEYVIGYTIGKNTDSELKDRKETISDRKEMNPNAVYYVNQDAFVNDSELKSEGNRVHGENVALKYNIGNGGEWYIHELRVFDGYDYAPDAPTITINSLKAHYGIFYTNLPTNKKTTISMPFDVRLSRLSNKGINFYKPTDLNATNGTITLDKQDGTNLEAAGTYIAESTNGSNWSNTGGYAVALASYPYKSEDAATNVEVAMSGKAEELNISGNSSKAMLESSFVSNKLTDGDVSNAYYLYSAATETFRPANDDWFNYETNPDHASTESPFHGKDYRLQLLPFYAYLKTPKVNSSQASKGFVFILEDETTGINTPQHGEGSAPDTKAPMYDLTGRRVNGNYRGIVIQNGKKHIRR